MKKKLTLGGICSLTKKDGREAAFFYCDCVPLLRCSDKIEIRNIVVDRYCNRRKGKTF